jgi:hypothetical protein
MTYTNSGVRCRSLTDLGFSNSIGHMINFFTDGNSKGSIISQFLTKVTEYSSISIILSIQWQAFTNIIKNL